MQAYAPAANFIALALLSCGLEKQRKPNQRDANSAPISQCNMHQRIVESNGFGQSKRGYEGSLELHIGLN